MYTNNYVKPPRQRCSQRVRSLKQEVQTISLLGDGKHMDRVLGKNQLSRQEIPYSLGLKRWVEFVSAWFLA